MGNTKKGFRALGLSFLAVLGFMAFAAAGAQGQAAGHFLDASGSLAAGTKFTGKQEGNGSLLVPGLSAAIECTVADVEGEVTGLGVAHAKIKFLNCIVRTSALANLSACAVGENGSVTANVKFLARLSGAGANTGFILAEPLTVGQPFALVLIVAAVGKFCAISGDYNATGTLALKVLEGNVNPQLVVPFANQAALGDAGLSLGVHPSTLDASATVEISGPAGLAGAAWGVC